MFIAKACMGDAVSQEWLDAAAKELIVEIRDEYPDEETLLLLDKRGEFSGLEAPRWLCHLIGLRHGTVHVVLWDANNEPRMIFQVRSKIKKDFPGYLELSVTGHGGTEKDWTAAAYKEMNEEIGIRSEDLREELIFVAPNFQAYDDDDRNFHDRECARIYTQRLRPSGIASLRLNKDEVEKLLFVGRDSVTGIYNKWKIAPGLKASLPIYLEWFSLNRALIY